MRIIDIHNHPDWSGHNINRFVDNMAKYEIDKTWLLSWECPDDEVQPLMMRELPRIGLNAGPVPFARCVAYAEMMSDKFILGYAPDPRRPGALDNLMAAVDSFDVRVCGELKVRMMLDNNDAVRMYKYCGQKGLPVIVHIDEDIDLQGEPYPRPSWWYGGDISALERVLSRCPDTIFVGHAPGFWKHISGCDSSESSHYPSGKVVPGGKVINLLCSYPNLYCDLSANSGLNALKRDLEHAVEFLTEFQDRVMYGRDMFDNRHQELINSLGLPESILRKIYAENALRLVPVS